jgi:hypothetical protein
MSVSMIEVDTGQLKRAVEAQHACTATLIQSVPVKETFEDEASRSRRLRTAMSLPMILRRPTFMT